MGKRIKFCCAGRGRQAVRSFSSSNFSLEHVQNIGAAAPEIGGIYGVADMQGIGTMEQKQLRLCQCLQLITPIWIMEALRDKTQGAAA